MHAAEALKALANMKHVAVTEYGTYLGDDKHPCDVINMMTGLRVRGMWDADDADDDTEVVLYTAVDASQVDDSQFNLVLDDDEIQNLIECWAYQEQQVFGIS